MQVATRHLPLGATVLDGGRVEFRVWAPNAPALKLRLMRHGAAPQEVPLERDPDGMCHAIAEAAAGDRYCYVPDGELQVPDPVSRLLPEGVHGPTEVLDPSAFRWTDANWRGLDLADSIMYELHVGTFTPEGTFAAAIQKLDYLRELGVTVVEIMPVAGFPGTRNWGYDSVSPYTVQASYGGPDGLRAFVDAAHARGLAVILDVIYNHLGNEGNYLRLFGPYFTDRHQTPWGESFNFDQPGSEHVREYFAENAVYWIREYHLDGLRLDAIQTIADDSPRHIIAEITTRVQQFAREAGRRVCLIAETDENLPHMVAPVEQGGFGLDGVWSDDFHHVMHTLLTGEREGYYQDFGRPEQLARALEQGFIFQGEPFAFWKGEPRGKPVGDMPLPAHVICIQNHDQVGNRAKGERLNHLVSLGARKAAAAILLLAPHTPLLFMGQEFDAPSPFQYFTNYSDAALAKATSEGRRREFKDFNFDEVPDPEDPETFNRSRLPWQSLGPENGMMLEWYRELIALRKRHITRGPRTARAEVRDGVLRMQVPAENPRVVLYASLVAGAHVPPPLGGGEAVLSSDDDGFVVRVFERQR